MVSGLQIERSSIKDVEILTSMKQCIWGMYTASSIRAHAYNLPSRSFPEIC